MKKILTILAAAAAIFGAASCSTGTMHDAEVMLVEKVVVEGLTELVGQEMVISGNWILGKDGTSTWVHGLGDSSKIAAGAIGTVDVDGRVEFKTNQLTSESTLEFLGKVNEAGWVSTKRFGEKAYADDNAKIPNAFSGPLVPKTILGRVQQDKSIEWSVVDAIAENRMVISKVVVKNLPAATYPDGTILEFKGFFNDETYLATNAAVSGGEATLEFLKPVVVTQANPTWKVKNVTTWDNALGVSVGGNDATVANPCTGPDVVYKLIGTVNADNSIAWVLSAAATDYIVGWEIVDGEASKSYVINGSAPAWSFAWNNTSVAMITTDASGKGSKNFPDKYEFKPADVFTGAVLKADGSGPDWDVDRFTVDNKPVSTMTYSVEKTEDTVSDEYVIRLTRTAENNWTWSLVVAE
ncbi:MAG: hypothetical protein EWM51_01670 [Treponema sp.]|nr:MAG: hypothetical protein EWM51_01670 [Treponema sp.]